MKQQKPVGLIASGRMSDSALLRHIGLVRMIGPVVAKSRRVASRYVNVLRAGRPGLPGELQSCQLIAVHARGREMGDLVGLAPRNGPPVAVLDDGMADVHLHVWRRWGHAACCVGMAPGPERPLLLVGGDEPAVKAARQWARLAQVRCHVLNRETMALYGAGLMAMASLVTPLVDAAVGCLRRAGVGPSESRRVVALVLDHALRSHAAHGRKAWPNAGADAKRLQVLEQSRVLGMVDVRLGHLRDVVLRACLEFYGAETGWLD